MKQNIYFSTLIFISMTACNLEHADVHDLGDSCPDAAYIVKDGTHCTDSTCRFDDVEDHNSCPDIYPVCAVDRENTFFCHEQCKQGEAFCDTSCIDPNSSDQYCGADFACRQYIKCGDDEHCQNGSCQKIGDVLCGSRWINPLEDNEYCGARENCAQAVKCDQGKICRLGQCQLPTDVKCGDNWIDPMTDNTYCGADQTCESYASCSAPDVCREGSCIDQSLIKCGGNWIDPMTDNAYCGARDNCSNFTTCAEDEMCTDGSCRRADYVKCGDNWIDPASDPIFCGADQTCSENSYSACSSTQNCIEGKCMECMKFDSPEVHLYALLHWDINRNSCITPDEAALVTEIPDKAFQNTHIATLDDFEQFPNLTEIGYGAFRNCSDLLDANLKNIESIGNNAFSNCSSLQYVNFPKTSDIGNFAFDGCTSLASLNLSNAAKIGYHAFYNCSALKSLSLPAANDIESYILNHNTNLTEIKLTAPGAVKSGTLLSDDNTAKQIVLVLHADKKDECKQETDGLWTWKGTHWKEIHFVSSNNCIKFNDTAFEKFALRSWDINKDSCISPSEASAVSKISDVCGESDLIPLFNVWDINQFPGLTTIQDNAFLNCSSLKYADLPKVTDVGIGSFKGCTSLKKVNLPEITRLPISIFEHCTSLKDDQKWFENLVEIKDSALKGCISLQNPKFPNVKQIGNSAFQNCFRLEYPDLPKINKLPANAFSECSLLKDSLPWYDNITEIGANAFSGCRSLKNLRFINAVTLSDRALSFCDSLESIDFPKLENIGQYIFSHYSSAFQYRYLKEIKLTTPEKIKTKDTSFGIFNIIFRQVTLTLHKNNAPADGGREWGGVVWKEIIIVE